MKARQATQKDPSFGSAWVRLADAHGNMQQFADDDAEPGAVTCFEKVLPLPANLRQYAQKWLEVAKMEVRRIQERRALLDPLKEAAEVMASGNHAFKSGEYEGAAGLYVRATALIAEADAKEGRSAAGDKLMAQCSGNLASCFVKLEPMQPQPQTYE